jgi:hypothetical protein
LTTSKLSEERSETIEELLKRYNKVKKLIPEGDDLKDVRLYDKPSKIVFEPNVDYKIFTISASQLELAKKISMKTKSIAMEQNLGNSDLANQQYLDFKGFLEQERDNLLNGMSEIPDFDDLIGTPIGGDYGRPDQSATGVLVFVVILYTL